MNKRLGFVGIILDDRSRSAGAVNAVLSEYADCIVGRMGIPHARQERSVITVIVDTTTDELGALTGKLGAIDGVSVKSALSKSSDHL